MKKELFPALKGTRRRSISQILPGVAGGIAIGWSDPRGAIDIIDSRVMKDWFGKSWRWKVKRQVDFYMKIWPN